MAYENLGSSALDYFPCRYGNSKLLFRGPRRKLETPYVTVLGGTETYGKFIAKPYAALLEDALGEPVINMGCVNAGIDVFNNDRTVIETCAEARVTVVELPGAQNLSNRFYAVHPRRNDRFLRASNLLKTIYREVDFTEFNFTRHLLSTLKQVSADKFAMIEQELREAWVARTKTLISKIGGRVVLLWLSERLPEDPEPGGIDGPDPLLVDREMMNEVYPFAAEVVEVKVSAAEIAAGLEDMVYSEFEAPAAREMLGPVAHRRVADALVPVLGRVG
jgi:hypothetical protein